VDYRTSLEFCPHDEKTRYELGVALEKVNKIEEAL